VIKRWRTELVLWGRMLNAPGLFFLRTLLSVGGAVADVFGQAGNGFAPASVVLDPIDAGEEAPRRSTRRQRSREPGDGVETDGRCAVPFVCESNFDAILKPCASDLKRGIFSTETREGFQTGGNRRCLPLRCSFPVQAGGIGEIVRKAARPSGKPRIWIYGEFDGMGFSGHGNRRALRHKPRGNQDNSRGRRCTSALHAAPCRSCSTYRSCRILRSCRTAGIPWDLA
jgi:hypothetical protein